MTRPHI